MTYILNEYGEIVETDEVFTNGRYVFVQGKMVRVGDGRRGPTHYAGSDNLGEGVQGLFNPADGKKYDSKAEYYNAVKAKGCEVVGDEPIKPSKPKLKEINWEKAVAETLQQMPKPKKKKGFK